MLAFITCYKYVINGWEQWKIYKNEEFERTFETKLNQHLISKTTNNKALNNILTTQFKKMYEEQFKNSLDQNEQPENVISTRTRKPIAN